jgi:hypothetical protein
MRIALFAGVVMSTIGIVPLAYGMSLPIYDDVKAPIRLAIVASIFILGLLVARGARVIGV